MWSVWRKIFQILCCRNYSKFPSNKELYDIKKLWKFISFCWPLNWKKQNKKNRMFVLYWGVCYMRSSLYGGRCVYLELCSVLLRPFVVSRAFLVSRILLYRRLSLYRGLSLFRDLFSMEGSTLIIKKKIFLAGVYIILFIFIL